MITQLLELHSWTVFDIDDDGRVLAGTDASGSMQLVEVAPDGAQMPLTALPGACSGRYLPGRRVVVVEHDDAGNERAQLSRLDIDLAERLPAELPELAPVVQDPAYIHTLVDVQPGAIVYRTNRRNGVDFDVIVRDLAEDVERVVYDAGGHVVDVDVDVAADAVAVTLASLRPASTQVRLVRAGRVEDLTGADEHAMHTWARLLPGGGVVMSSNRGRDMRAIVTVDEAGSWTTVLADDEHDIDVVPSPDGQRWLILRNVDGADALELYDAEQGRPGAEIVLPRSGVVEAVWSPDSSRVALGLNSPTSPGDIYVVDASTGAVRTVVDGATHLDATVRSALVEPVSVRVPARDGEKIPCFVYASPHPAEPALRSVVINIHGGPEAQARRQFSAVNQALVAAGHVVLVPNVRGSSGYGKRWYSLDDVTLRLESVLDIVDVRSWVLVTGGDPDRVALFGGSYGGYMVLAAVSMHPGLWAAGVDIVGMSSLVSFLENTSDYRRAVREREYGSLADDREFLIQASPLTYVHAIDTPLFVIHGANDPRVPLSEAEQIKAALDDKGVACELLVFDDEGHGLAKRVNRLAAYPAALSFLDDLLSA